MKSFQKVEELAQNIEKYCHQNVIAHSTRKRLGFTYFSVLDNLVKKNPALSGLEILRKRSLLLLRRFHKI